MRAHGFSGMTTPCCDADVGRIEWDTQIVGLGLRRRRGRSPEWVMRVPIDGKSLWQSLGDAGEISQDSARRIIQQFREHRGEVYITQPTASEFGERFLKDRKETWTKQTLSSNRSAMSGPIGKAFGHRLASAITRADVRKWLSQLGDPRPLAVLSQLMEHAELMELRPEGSNPCRGLRRRKQVYFTAFYPTEDNFHAIGKALRERYTQQPVLSSLILFLALTGARRGEALGLRWSDINENGAQVLDGKEGRRTIALPAPVRALLSRLRHDDERAYVFSREDGQPMSSSTVSAFWSRIRKSAGVAGMRVHDLRHGYASTGINNGHQLSVVGALLGHRDYSSTQAYAHLSDKTVAAAARSISIRIQRQMLSVSGERSA